MNKILGVIKWSLTLGKEPQNFLGAKWIGKFLARIPESKKRVWALRILDLSPHYFIFPDAPEYQGMSKDEYLEAAFGAIAESRENIYQNLLKVHLEKNYKVIDYGCGPGFLAKAAAPFVENIYGIDISSGVIECAKIVNSAENIEYLRADASGLKAISDESVDAIYSYAVVQHLTNEILELVLENCRQKLKPDGKLLLHVQMPDEIWQTEEDWKKDNSLTSKIKYNYGLHCFGRTQEEYSAIVEKRGFRDVQFEKLEGFDAKYDEELKSQRLLVAYKKG